VIAVDGPAASGKSTLARRLAARLGLPFLDTGLLYRAVGRRLLARGGDPGDVAAATAAAKALTVQDVEHPGLRDEAVGQAASRVAAFAAVREALLPFQRRFAETPGGAVLAGRDVGTVVCPAAPIKIFITASVEERARRRYEELRQRGQAPIYSAVLEELRERDRRDEERAVAPLRIAADAWVLDTTHLDADAAFEAALRHIERSR
jgi:cytidylate kinase